MQSLILAGDIGGTKINIASFTHENGALTPVARETYLTASFDNIESLLNEFLGDKAGRIAAACFGVAGPVEEGRVSGVNIPWGEIREETLRRHLRTNRVAFLNDMIAMAWGALVMPADKLFALNPGDPAARGNAALIAAGTGLGEALLHWDGARWQPSPSEGGHADFGPTNELELDLLRYLMKVYGRVSYERILSGPGLFNIYRFLKETGRGEEPEWLARRMTEEDPSRVITETALAGGCAICERAIGIFVHVYGAEAGNMMLKGLATAGVFIGGGIAPRILEKLNQETFMDGFTNKGRLKSMMERVPVKVLLDPAAPLLGAAHFAAMMLHTWRH